MVTAGFPCQPSSTAGKRAGPSDERWLWPEVARVVGEVRPEYVCLENVPGLLTVSDGSAHAEVLGDLVRLGYDTEWCVLAAADVGAPHLRRRWFALARRRDGVADSEGVGRPGRVEPQPDLVDDRLQFAYGGEELADAEGGGAPAGELGERPRGAVQGRDAVADAPSVGAGARGAERGPPPGGHVDEGGGVHERGLDELAEPARGPGADVPPTRIGRPAGSFPRRVRGAVADAAGDLRGAPGDGGQGPPHGAGYRDVGDAGGAGLPERGGVGGDDGQEREAPERAGIPLWPPGPGEREEWERVLARWPDLAPATVEPVRSVADGVSEPRVGGGARNDQLRAYGNSCSPLQAGVALRLLHRRLTGDCP